MQIDLSPENIASIHQQVLAQDKDLYSFLKERLPELGVEERLQYLSAILNDHLEDYRWRNDDELKDEGYFVKRFFPKNRDDA